LVARCVYSQSTTRLNPTTRFVSMEVSALTVTVGQTSKPRRCGLKAYFRYSITFYNNSAVLQHTTQSASVFGFLNTIINTSPAQWYCTPYTHLHRSPTIDDDVLTFRYWFQICIGFRCHNLTKNITSEWIQYNVNCKYFLDSRCN